MTTLNMDSWATSTLFGLFFRNAMIFKKKKKEKRMEKKKFCEGNWGIFWYILCFSIQRSSK
jgi:hypothetical protein